MNIKFYQILKTALSVKTSFLFIVAVCFSTVGSAQNFESANVRKGEVYIVRAKVEKTLHTKAMARNIELKATLDGQYEVTVDSIENDGILVSGILKDIKTFTSAAGQKIRYDTKNPEKGNPDGEDIQGVLNQSHEVLLDKSGHLKKDIKPLSDTSEVLNRLLKFSLNGGPEGVFFTLPAGIKVGESFKVKKENKRLGTTSNVLYTLKSRENGIARISFKGDLTNINSVKKLGVTIDTDTKGTISGELVTDTKMGVLLFIDNTIVLRGIASLTGQDLDVKATIKTKSAISLQ